MTVYDLTLSEFLNLIWQSINIVGWWLTAIKTYQKKEYFIEMFLWQRMFVSSAIVAFLSLYIAYDITAFTFLFIMFNFVSTLKWLDRIALIYRFEKAVDMTITFDALTDIIDNSESAQFITEYPSGIMKYGNKKYVEQYADYRGENNKVFFGEKVAKQFEINNKKAFELKGKPLYVKEYIDEDFTIAHFYVKTLIKVMNQGKQLYFIHGEEYKRDNNNNNFKTINNEQN